MKIFPKPDVPLCVEPQAAQKLVKTLGVGWRINDAGHLEKEYRFDDFKTAMTFANQVAFLAEQEAHHPDLKVSWGMCGIEIWTHSVKGLTQKDFSLATQIEVLH